MKTQIFDSILQINNKYSSNEQIKCSKEQKSSNKQKKSSNEHQNEIV